MNKPKQTWSRTRRDFLRGAVATGGAAAVAALAPGHVAAEPAEPEAGNGKGQGQGYRLTPHIVEYYKTINN